MRLQVAAQLKKARQGVALTQKQVAEKLHMTQQQYSRFETGIFELNYGQIVFLCKLFEITADYLFGLEN